MKRIVILCAFIWTVFFNVNASEFNIDHKPAAADENLVRFFGEYMLAEEKILIREDGGKLQALINPPANGMDIENIEKWLLTEGPKNEFIYEINGKLSKLSFKFDENDQGKEIIIDRGSYIRNYIEPKDGSSFKVTLKKSIEEYIKIALEAKPPVREGDFRDADLVDVTTVLDKVKLDIRYATTNNFLSVPTYSQAKSFLQRPALMALNEANKKLNALGFGIIIHDTYRPWYVTKVFWDTTSGFERDFVANPESGSKHNMGSAVDMTLYDLETGEVIKMVGTYDEMSDRSYPEYMGGTSLERWHRDLLRTYVEAEGFKVVSNEWWHFDHEEWQKYPILNETFEQLLGEN